MLGIPVAFLRWIFGRVPLYRRNRGHPGEPQVPDPDRPLPGDPSSLQRVGDGVGPLFNRRYWIDVTDTDYGPEELLGEVARNLNAFVPREMSRFDAVHDPDLHDLREGDELVVRLPGPWEGPVRVVERTPTSFRFATLRGHFEAGEIEFRARRTERGFLRFEIESWTRSGNPLFHLLYDRFRLGQEMQLQMWAQFCMRAAERCGGVVMSNVQAQTSERPA